ncbi:hypothetical protein EC991_008405 [Linnemannia zychae]|nr:hypothetical protein EC991_008405 [Linnemannia zychae]
MEVRLWDLHSYKDPYFLKQTPKVNTKLCTRYVAFTPTGLIVLGFDNNEIYLYDPHGQDPCTALKKIPVDGEVAILDCSPDGQEVAIVVRAHKRITDMITTGTVYFWDFQSEMARIELIEDNKGVFDIAYSPCGKWMVLGGIDGTIRIWRVRFGRVNSWSCVAVVVGCSQTIFSVAWNPAVTLEFVTGCGDGSLRVWRIGSHDYNDEGDVSVQMLWGNDVGLLCASNLTLKGAVGLSPLNQKLLLQRGAIGDSTTEGFESSD